MQGYVYIVGCKRVQLYKVGIAVDVEKRMKSLQTGCPHPLTLIAKAHCPNPRVIEKEIHALLNFYRKQGEWFCCTLEDIRKAKRHMENLAYLQERGKL